MPKNTSVGALGAIPAINLTPAVKEELKKQGFPDYMCYSFIETAKATDTIILSRLPGGVGTDLIEDGYDLKGFHIKAKSCNWGPMAGFICQLPVFNKAGIAKAEYNTKQVLHYLVHLDHFSGKKAAIDTARAAKEKDLKDASKDRAQVEKTYNDTVSAILKEVRKVEQNTGEWSGENNIRTALPFINLRRGFASVDVVKKMRGVENAILIKEGLIYGIAYNITDEENEDNSKPTVITEFVLRHNKANDGTWDIYHGRIKYKKKETDAGFDQTFTAISKADLVPGMLDDHPKLLAHIYKFSTELFEFDDEELKKAKALKSKYASFPVIDDEVTFQKVMGFVNPFPPFKLGQTPDLYYKNAVSGDYDLFGMWPARNVPEEDLIRQSELTTEPYCNMGGKVFTAYIGRNNNFAIEFVPGFGELNPHTPEDILKESAEFGNMNNLCHLVSGYLNSFASHFISIFNKHITSKANKGFHSDEGGRPGIMEIEFPIAVFTPKAIKSVALNNVYVGGQIPAIANRGPAIDTWGGLIKTPEELVLFITECMNADFRVFMHYRWMIHLLYNTIPKGNVEPLFKALLTPAIVKKIQGYDAKFVLDPPKYLKEFIEIDKNRAVIDSRFVTNQTAYEKNLAWILTGSDAPDQAFITDLCKLMIPYTYMSDMPSYVKCSQVDELHERSIIPA